MFIFGHTGLTLESARRISNVKVRLTVVAAIALLPDVVDKSIHYVISSEFTNGNTRTIAHSILFTLVLMTIIRGAELFKWGKKLELRNLWWIPIMHLLLDGMWTTDLRISLLWPFLGCDFPPYAHKGWWDHLMRTLTTPHIMFGELLGLYFVYRYKVRSRPRNNL